MKRKPTQRDVLPLSKGPARAGAVPTGEAFDPEWIDFDRGIRVGHLEPHERITQILKHRLEEEYGTPFVTDRWGRGVYWQWICWLPRANRDAKEISSAYNFGCSKLYIMADRTRRVFECGLQVERGFASGKPDYRGSLLAADWDWHRLVKGCAAADGDMDREMRRLIVKEGFEACIHEFETDRIFDRKSFTSARRIANIAHKCRKDRWAGFQLYYPMTERDTHAGTGYELVQAVLGAFAEVIPVMNLCMQTELHSQKQTKPLFPRIV